MQSVTIIDLLGDGHSVGSSDLSAMEKAISKAMNSEERGYTSLLILDGLDFLMSSQALPAQTVLDVIEELRSKAHSTVVTTCSDAPLLQFQATPLERSQAAFTLSLAHEASRVMSVRELDTGVAKDVSGVLRITHGGDNWGHNEGQQSEETECLYHVGADGGTRVFARGA